MPEEGTAMRQQSATKPSFGVSVVLAIILILICGGYSYFLAWLGGFLAGFFHTPGKVVVIVSCTLGAVIGPLLALRAAAESDESQNRSLRDLS